MKAETGQEVVKVVWWDPKSAFIMHVREQKERRYSREIADGLAKMPDSDVSNRTVTINTDPDNPLVLNMPEYVEWLAQQADIAREEVKRFGGEKAVQAFQATMQEGDFYPDGTPTKPDLRPSTKPFPVPVSA
jgi:hypothetical protein